MLVDIRIASGPHPASGTIEVRQLDMTREPRTLGGAIVDKVEDIRMHALGLKTAANSGQGSYRDFSADIAAAADHLSRIVEGLGRSAPKGEGTELPVFDAISAAQEAVRLVLPLAQASETTVDDRIPEMPGQVLGVRGNVQQILINLLTNAIKFSPEGGHVSIRAHDDGEYLRFEVDDNGPGIPEADRDRIFDAFERLGSDVEGKGLGLNISKRLAEEMGGELSAGANPGGGARMTLRLRRA